MSGITDGPVTSSLCGFKAASPLAGGYTGWKPVPHLFSGLLAASVDRQEAAFRVANAQFT